MCFVSRHLTRTDCHAAGHRWTGFDASGHCFLLSWNNLFIVEEFIISTKQLFMLTAQKDHIQHNLNGQSGSKLFRVLDMLCCCLVLLILLGWYFVIFSLLTLFRLKKNVDVIYFSKT